MAEHLHAVLFGDGLLIDILGLLVCVNILVVGDFLLVKLIEVVVDVVSLEDFFVKFFFWMGYGV